MRWGVLLLALLSLANTGDEPVLRVRVSPAIAQSPATVTLHLVIERHPGNRGVRITIDGPNYYQSGIRQIEGDQGRHVWDEAWKDVPCGHYVVSVVLLRVVHEDNELKEQTFVAYGESRVSGEGCVMRD